MEQACQPARLVVGEFPTLPLVAGILAAIQEDSPIPDYAFPGVDNERLATGLAGFTGTLGVFALGYGLAFVLRRRSSAGPPRGAPA